MVHIHAEGPAFFCWIPKLFGNDHRYCSSHNVTVDYAFQDINDIPGTLPEGRTKPWGTGQAVLAAKKKASVKLDEIVIYWEQELPMLL